MDDNSQQQPPMNGNDELAKALGGLQFEETPAGGNLGGNDPAPSLMPASDDSSDSSMGGLPMPPQLPDDNSPLGEPAEIATPEEPKEEPAAVPLPEPVAPLVEEPKDEEPKREAKHDDDKKGNGGDTKLEKIKTSALEELRPLVGKLKLSPEEKFDTLLLIIRSTDDHSLLNEAHAAAKDISDETKRAQALLDIIKEVDYFSSKS